MNEASSEQVAASTRPIILLGPQRFQPNVAKALETLAVESAVAVVTAGWEERELEDQELQQHIGRPALNLKLYWRTEDLFQHDRELKAALLRRHDRLRRLHRVHRQRLGHTLASARELMQDNGDAELLDPERESAIHLVRELDHHHQRRVREIHGEFDAKWKPYQRPHVARQREELRHVLQQTGGLLIAGGHVAVLTNRLRLFGLLELAELPVVAWSAGAMALSDRIVLFHDSPPQGFGDPEILEHGFGLCPGIVVLPHAHRRLDLKDASRVSLFARRFAPARCLTLEEGSELEFHGNTLVRASRSDLLEKEGNVGELALS